MDFHPDTGLAAFRQEVRQFLAELPAELRNRPRSTRSVRADVQRWQNILNARGWGAPYWAKEHGGPPGFPYEPWDDGYTVHAPVDAFDPNPFGFHGMLGNVWEWCEDGFLPYLTGSETDPVAPASSTLIRVRRGGCYGSPALDTRSSCRGSNSQQAATNDTGLRPARAITR